MNSSNPQPEPWLRGPVAGIPTPLQPLAHAFIAAGEDIERAVGGLTGDELWAQPGGIAPLGFHLAHLAGATDRLLTYARGKALSEGQREALVHERQIDETRPSVEELLGALGQAIRRALEELAATDESTLTRPRAVGRAQAPSSVLGLLSHAAEHAARHAGQIVTTSKLIRGSRTAASS